MQLVLDSAHLRRCGCTAHVRTQTSYDLALMKVVMLQELGRGIRLIWNPQLDACIGISEPRRQYTDHGEGPAVEVKLATHNLYITGKPSLEHAPGQHDNGIAGPVFRLSKCSPQRRLHSQEWKQIPRASSGTDPLRQFVPFPGQVVPGVTQDGHVCKTGSLRAPIVKVRWCNRVVDEVPSVRLLPTMVLIQHY